MQKNRIALIRGAAATICIMLFSSVIVCSASSSIILKKGMRGTEVTSLQNDLKKLGYFNANATGYFGDITTTSVKKLQKEYGYTVDGIVGKNTFSLLDQLTGKSSDSSSKNTSESSSNTSSRSSTSTSTRSSTGVLKKGMRGNEVKKLQADLKKLGYFNSDITGYFGDITTASVKNLQKKHGYIVDGIAGEKTQALLKKLTANAAKTPEKQNTATSTSSRSSSERVDYMPKWFGGAEKIFKIGSIATVYDITSGLSFKIKRTYGHNHADCETLTTKDTNTLKKIYGGSFSWNRRAIILDVGGRKLAASMAGMPHAGLDSAGANKIVNSRSGGYGRGTNLDAVKNNGMNGVIDVHFYQSKTHGTNKVDSKHQAAVKKANEWAKKNY